MSNESKVKKIKSKKINECKECGEPMEDGVTTCENCGAENEKNDIEHEPDMHTLKSIDEGMDDEDVDEEEIPELDSDEDGMFS